MTERVKDDSTALPANAVIGRIADLCYGAYAWLAFLPCFAVAVLGALLLPGLERRRRWVSAAARAWFALAGIRVRLHGFERIPQGHCIVVANHASYLDGMILQAWLPPRFSFVIKGEMTNVPVAHLLLKRIGSRFVERYSAGASARDARRLLRAAANGESLAFFPEGTFHPRPGLHAFRPGAFAAAIKAGLPIVPLAIRGSRRILPARRRLPRRADLELEVLEPINPGDPGWESSAALAEAARRRILAVVGEPDLAKGRPAGRAA
jgi:1-acyl-sn-glycerol-3-phosphate acyltransferase